MYKTEYNEAEETKFIKHLILWTVLLFVLVGAGLAFVNTTSQVASTAVVRYEEFQEIYNTCQKINTDLGTIKAVDETDRMFANFSKSALIVQKRQQLSRWVEEYNAKSKMWTRSMWKSDALPYELNVNMFSNY